MPFVTITWLDLEGIMLNKISQRKTYDMIPLICEILKNEQINQDRIRLTDKEKKLEFARGVRGGESWVTYEGG